MNWRQIIKKIKLRQDIAKLLEQRRLKRTTTNYGLQFTENPRIRTDYWTNYPTIQRHTKPPPSKH